MPTHRALLTAGITGLTMAGLIVTSLPASLANNHSLSVRPETSSLAVENSLESGEQGLSGEELYAYWTDERIRTSKPMETPTLNGPVAESQLMEDVAHAAANPEPDVPSIYDAPSQPTVPDEIGQVNPAAVTAPKTFGRLVFTDPDGKRRNCSASVVTSKSRSTIMTAAHCVYRPEALTKSGKEFAGKKFGRHTNFVFMPGYNNGPNESYGGRWEAKKLSERYAPQWKEEARQFYDQAFLELLEKNGKTITDKVGANGFQTTRNLEHPGARVWGHPTDKHFKGNQEPRRCDGDAKQYTYWDKIRNRIAYTSMTTVPCNFTKGASGGPWFKSQENSANNGIVFAVTLAMLDGENAIVAYPNTPRLRKLRDNT